MKRWLWLGAAAVLAGALWFAARGKSHSTKPQALNFLFTCDVRGRLVPCGCFSGQLGGLTRISTFFGPPQAEEIRVDVGDALAGSADYERIQYGYLQQAFARMSYEALNIGHREARLNAAQLRALKAQAPVTMLSANLLDRATGAPLFETHKIVRHGAWRIALVGLMETRGLGEILGEGLLVEEPEVALGKLLPTLKSQADAIVLLAFADEAALAALARQFNEINIILGGKVRQPSQQLVQENRSLILATTNESRAVGVLQTRVLAAHRVEAIKGEVSLVSDQIPQDDAIAALAIAYRDEIRRTKLAIDDPATLQEDMVPGVQARAAYAGTESCAQCHAGAMQAWAKSGHAHAFASLFAFKADADPNCISCHTVGFGNPSGYERKWAGAKLADVGCESCHGPGSQHVAERTAGDEVTMRFRPIGAGDCQKCHHGEFSRPFAWDEFWPLIEHGKEMRPRISPEGEFERWKKAVPPALPASPAPVTPAKDRTLQRK
jgi:nitrate/TMAO reductase-like tetraheme cytochrome c subunit